LIPGAYAATNSLSFPESQEDEAHRVGNRIREVSPPTTNTGISASIGISVYRRDGERIGKTALGSGPGSYEKGSAGRRAALLRPIPAVVPAKPETERIEPRPKNLKLKT